VEASNYRKILTTAQDLVQLHGFNAFSYRDLSNAIGIKTSSIHYYFPTKEDLGETLVKEYRSNFQNALDEIENSTDDYKTMLEKYVSLFVSTLRQNGKICLCGMLASDFQTLSEKIQTQVRLFFDENEMWLAEVLRKGKETNSFDFEGEPREIAATFFASLEGAMLVARVYQDNSRLQKVADSWLLAIVKN
jgi:TetR/AcrR family transcriptional repressor of nem operon